MSEQDNKSGGHITASMSDREKVEKTADRLRDELLLTLEELERRRERALDVKYQLRHVYEKNRELVHLAGGVALGLLGLGLGYSVWRTRHREELLWRHRRQALRRAWEHPDRVASSAEERPFPIELGSKLVIIFGTALATALARNAVQTLVPARPAHGKRGGLHTQALHGTQAPAHA
jgi:hypothetical protein